MLVVLPNNKLVSYTVVTSLCGLSPRPGPCFHRPFVRVGFRGFPEFGDLAAALLANY